MPYLDPVPARSIRVRGDILLALCCNRLLLSESGPATVSYALPYTPVLEHIRTFLLQQFNEESVSDLSC